jgi:hypothetical protein
MTIRQSVKPHARSRWTDEGGALSGAVSFTQQPVGGLAAVPLTVQPIVSVKTPDSLTDVFYIGPVVIEVLNGVTVVSTFSIFAVAGIAVYSGIQVSAGTYSMRATAPDKSPAISSPFTVT